MARKLFKFWNPALICFVVTLVASMIFLMGLPIGAFFDGKEPSLEAFRPMDSSENRFLAAYVLAIIAPYLISGLRVGRGRAAVAINVVSCVVMIAATFLLLLHLAGIAFSQAMQH